MKKYNLSEIMKRAWEIKKQDSRNIFSLCLRMAWKEVKEMKEDLLDTLKTNLEAMAFGDYHINLGVDRKVSTRESDGRTYLSIACYTANGRYKGAYKCGYVVDDTYVCGKYDDVDALNKEYIGR